MDDQALIQTYGNTVLSEGTADRPIVTFALFAYNQEKYIRDAVEGAFSQTYSPLEIILSDDCSSDRTFAIMEEMARTYRGPHLVRVRRSRLNRGVGLHIDDVLKQSKGEFLVVGAGDDISFATRTQNIINLMIAESADYAESKFNMIDEQGKIIRENMIWDHLENSLLKIVQSGDENVVFGATAAYRRSFISGALNSARKALESGYLNNEDMLFGAYGIATKARRASFVSGPLVDYRFNASSISNFVSPRITFDDEFNLIRREIFVSRSRISILSAIIEMSDKFPEFAQRVQHKKCEDKIRHHTLLLKSSELDFLTRLSSVWLVRSPSELRTCLPRLLGPYTLTIIRVLRNKLMNGIR